jgi:hypothetical protein
VPEGGEVIDLLLAREIQSGNALAYRHWRVRHKDKVAWLLLLRAQLRTDKCVPAGRKAVTITAYRKRRLDDDNLIAGAKHLRDSLITVGLIKDDNATWAAFTYRQELASASPLGKGKPCTSIQIEET